MRPLRGRAGCVVDGTRGLRPRDMGWVCSAYLKFAAPCWGAEEGVGVDVFMRWVCSAYLKNVHPMDAVENDLIP